MAGTGSKGQGKFKCKICRMIFDSKEELKEHLMEDHNDN
jgi:tRNA(Ile2) C34 agmatinyltransferase TiaS